MSVVFVGTDRNDAIDFIEDRLGAGGDTVLAEVVYKHLRELSEIVWVRGSFYMNEDVDLIAVASDLAPDLEAE